MSIETDKVSGINQLAIFPLPLVLLPHELLPLHIFEPRYREMISDVEAENNIFGISMIDTEARADGKPLIDSIGCAAEIREHLPLEGGRSNILTNGIIRYRIRKYVENEKPYFVSEVDFFEDDGETDADTLKLADEVFELFKRVAAAAHKISGGTGELPEIPQEEPEQLSFMIGAALNMNIELKYGMLEMRSTNERLSRLNEILLDAVDKVEETAKINKISRTNGYAKKDIDLGGI